MGLCIGYIWTLIARPQNGVEDGRKALLEVVGDSEVGAHTSSILRSRHCLSR